MAMGSNNPGGQSPIPNSGGNANPQTPVQTPTPEPTQPGGENNTPDNADRFADLWHNPQDVANKPVPIPQELTAEQKQAALAQHITKLDLAGGVDFSKIAQDMQAGDPASLKDAFATVTAKAYQAALANTNNLMNHRIAQAVAEAVSQSSSKYEGNQAVTAMETRLPFTKGQHIGPIAKAALGQFMKKGQPLNTAVESVKELFADIHKTSAKDLGLNLPPRGRPGSNQFNQGADTNDDAGDDAGGTDWTALLGGQS